MRIEESRCSWVAQHVREPTAGSLSQIGTVASLRFMRPQVTS